jgi:adenosine deaminase
MTSELPKAELHCHIEGAAEPVLVQAQAARYNVDVSAIIHDGAFVWHDFTSFLAAYDLAASLFRTSEDYALLADHYLTSLAADGAIYSEFFISIDHAAQNGLAAQAYVEGLAEGMRAARDRHGIESRMIAIGVRHFGPESVEATALWAARNRHPLIAGFGMAGDERQYRAADFRRAFDVAREAGLGITCHAGELCGAESVRGTLDFLRPSRLGHGVRAIEDLDLVRRISGEGIVLEICSVSNVALGVFRSFAEHPLPALHAMGCRITLNSDDPPHFHTSLAREYTVAERKFGFRGPDLLEFTRNALAAAFIDGETRARLLEKCAMPGIG